MNGIEVKGTGLISTRTYVKEKHPERYNDWFNTLPSDCQLLYGGVISSSDWFDVEKYYYTPLKAIANMFFGGNEQKAAIEVGKFSADFGLKGVYKVFLLVASPQALMKAAKRIISMYYRPVDAEISEVNKKSIILTATKLHKASEILDYRTIGWCVKALELVNCQNVIYQKVENPNPQNFSVKFSWD